MSVTDIKKAPEAIVRESMGDGHTFNKLLTEAMSGPVEDCILLDYDIMKAVSGMDNREGTTIYKSLVSAAHSLRLQGEL